MTGWEFRIRRLRQRLKIVVVGRRTGLVPGSISAFENGYIPYYVGRDILDKFYRELEYEEIDDMVSDDPAIARKVILEELGADIKPSDDWFQERTRKRMRELIELHPRKFFESYDGCGHEEFGDQAA